MMMTVGAFKQFSFAPCNTLQLVVSIWISRCPSAYSRREIFGPNLHAFRLMRSNERCAQCLQPFSPSL